MKDGDNNITLENYVIRLDEDEEPDEKVRAENERNWIDRRWQYQMYGTAKEVPTPVLLNVQAIEEWKDAE